MIKIKHLGISIGIFGCLFKLMSWAGASTLLIIGLSLLGIFYLIKVFEKNKKTMSVGLKIALVRIVQTGTLTYDKTKKNHF